MPIAVMISVVSSKSFSVRLQNGKTYRSGMVQQLVGNDWKFLCGDACWTNKTANVTCNELGFQEGIRPNVNTIMNGNHTPAKYQCKGDEKHLRECQFISECFQCQHVAEVECLGDVRLNDITTDKHRVETLRKNADGKFTWGSLCSTCWTGNNTHVVCKQFGFGSGTTVDAGLSNGTRWMHVQFKCIGNEKHLSNCHTLKEHCVNCKHDAGVMCSHNELNFNETCTGKTRCIHGLVCKHTERNVCRCEDELQTFWNVEENMCTRRSGLDEECILSMNNSCKDTLVCAEGELGVVCRYQNVSMPTTEDGRKKSNFNETCTDNASCVNGLVCKEQGICKCENELMTFWNAEDKMCTQRSGLGERCTLKMYDSCRESLVCSEDASGAVCRHQNVSVTTTGGGRKSPPLWPIYVGVTAAVLMVLLIITACCYKRKRGNNPKIGQKQSYNKQQQIRLNDCYIEAILDCDVSVNGNQDNQLDDTRRLTNDREVMYSLAQSTASAPTTESVTKTTETDHYGYGILGGKRTENDDEGMYSHAKQWCNTGEYDTFVRNERDTDVNDIYDRTRDFIQEGQYDEFQRKK
ncbi:scavenger receptor cysteine-rich domain superfamily protein-like isoform X2 [Ylistrum balloti]|uniref:scavenger receptor cysteine-rich domain superfamily protein-like isoform X2 n=1 Tax=Ylistrum balloti TaxID=509963 RepID=UPI002905DDAF|nr:scavenger receptor cysteine-rich domain superfamily protein-like isoform X2 [Ylistrum balloti]